MKSRNFYKFCICFRSLKMSIERLPTEILEKIFSSIELKDLLNISLTCRRFREVGSSSEIWRIMFQRNLEDLYDKVVEANTCPIDWKLKYEQYYLKCKLFIYLT